MLQTALMILADDPGGGSKTPANPEFSPNFLLIIMGVLLFMIWMTSRRGKQQERERQSLFSGLKKNDKVLTTAGIYGTIVSVSDKEDEVVVKVDDSTRLRMVKAAIMRNLSNEEAQKAEQEKAKEKK